MMSSALLCVNLRRGMCMSNGGYSCRGTKCYLTNKARRSDESNADVYKRYKHRDPTKEMYYQEINGNNVMQKWNCEKNLCI